MKKIVYIFLCLFISMMAIAQPPAGNANVGDTYGKTVKKKKVKEIAQLPAMLAKEDKIKAKVKAEVLEVCENRGCWMKLKVNDSVTAFVKMKDYGFFVPLAAVGKKVIIEGEAFIKTVAVAELRHYARDAKKSEQEVNNITEPEKEINILASGIVVVE